MSILGDILGGIKGVGEKIWDTGKSVVDYTEGMFTKDEEDKTIDKITPENAGALQKVVNWAEETFATKEGKKEYINNLIEAQVGGLNEKLPSEALENGITVKQIADYKLMPSRLSEQQKEIIQKFNLDKYLDKNTALNILELYGKGGDFVDEGQILKGSLNRAETYNVVNDSFGKDIKKYIEKGDINKEDASELFRKLKDYAAKTEEYKEAMESNPEAFRGDNELKYLLTYRDKLVKDYGKLLAKKIGEYKGDKEKLENDKELGKLGDEISDLDGTIKTRLSWQSFKGTNWSNPMKYWRLIQTGITAATVGIGKEGRLAENLYNATLGNLTNTHLEQGMGIQQEVGDNGVIDKMINFATDIAPGAIVTVGGVGAIGKINTSSKIGTLGKWFAENEIINGTFNSYFDPALSSQTKAADLAMDIAGTVVTKTVGGALYYGLTQAAIRKYGDEIVKITDNEGREFEFKVGDLIGKDENEFLENVGGLAKANALKQRELYKLAIEGVVDKLEKLSSKKSGIINGALVRKAKLNVINGVAKELEKIGFHQKAKILKDAASSAKGVDIVYNSIKKTFQEVGKQVDDSITKLNNLTDIEKKLAEAQKLLDDKKIIQAVGKAVKDDGEIEPKAAKLPTADEVVVEQQIKNNVPVDPEKQIAVLSKAIGETIEELNKKHKYKIPYKEFSKKVISVLEENIGKLPEEYKKQFQNILNNLYKGEKIFKDVNLSFVKKIKGKSDGLGSHQGNKIKILKSLYKDPEQFFIVLFHELSHNRSYKFFEKGLTKKEKKAIEKIYSEFEKGLKQVEDKLTEEEKRILEVLVNKDGTINKEEFLAYIVGELAVSGKSDILNRFANILEKHYGIKVEDIDTLKRAIGTYVSSRFLGKGGNKLSQEIHYMVNLGKGLEEGVEVIKDTFKDMFKYKDLKTIDDAIYSMTREELEDVLKELGIKIDVSNIGDNELKDILNYQIHMNLVGDSGFKAAAIWNAIGDVLDAKVGKKVAPNINYLYDFIKAEDVDVILSLVNQNIRAAGKFGKVFQTVLDNLARTKELDTRNFVEIAYIWDRILKSNGIKPKLGEKSSENMTTKFIDIVGRRYDITDKYKGVNELLASIGYKLKRKKNAVKIKNDLLNGTFDFKKYANDIEKVETNIPNLAEYNYTRFNADLAFYLNELAGVGGRVNKKLYNQYKKSEELAKQIGESDIGRTQNIGLPDKYGRPLIYQAGKNKYIYTDKSGRTVLYNVKTGTKEYFDNTNKIIINGIVDDRSARALELMGDVFSKENYEDIYLGFKNKLGCL